MRRRSFRFSIAAILVLGGFVAVLAVVSGGRAGSVPNPSNFQLSVQPPYLTAGAEGFVMGKFTAASGSGTGSATHVSMTFDLPVGLLNPTPTSSDCSPSSSPPSGYNRFICTIGTVNAGNIVKRFVTFIAPLATDPPTTYTISGFASFDGGSGGASGGGSTNTSDTKTGSTTVVAVGNEKRAGNCLSASPYNVFTPAVSATDTQGTSLSFGSAAFPLPCTWATVGEDLAPSGFTIPYISFVSAPVFASLAQIQISIYQLPLSKIGSLTEYPDYPALTNPLTVLPCPSPTSLPVGRDACELPRSKNGNVTLLTLLFAGTGGDPGFGGG